MDAITRNDAALARQVVDLIVARFLPEGAVVPEDLDDATSNVEWLEIFKGQLGDNDGGLRFVSRLLATADRVGRSGPKLTQWQVEALEVARQLVEHAGVSEAESDLMKIAEAIIAALEVRLGRSPLEVDRGVRLALGEDPLDYV